MKIYIDFDDVICETAKHITKLAEELFGIVLPDKEIRFFNLQKAFDITDDQYALHRCKNSFVSAAGRKIVRNGRKPSVDVVIYGSREFSFIAQNV